MKRHIIPFRPFVYTSLLLLLIINFQIVVGQKHLSFNHITVEDGLSSGSVLSISQDEQGFLWVGTMDGLNRYDGNKVKIYRSFYKENPIGAGLKITKLLADKDQNLWIGTNNGLYQYDYRRDSFFVFIHNPEEKKSISNNNITALFMDHEGHVWVGTENGLNRIHKTSSYEFDQVPLFCKDAKMISPFVQTIFETASGNLLIGTSGGIVSFSVNPFLESNCETKLILEGNSISSITGDRNQNIWVGTIQSGLFKLSKQLSVIKNLKHSDEVKTSLINNTIRKLKLDKEGRLWIGTLNGLSILNPDTEFFSNYIHKSDDENSLNFNSIYDIFEDRQGNIWVGTFFGGLNVAEAITTNFRIFKDEDRNDWINSNVISSIVNGPDDGLWIGTEAEGLYYFNRKMQKFHSFKNDESGKALLNSNLVKALVVDHSRNLWVGMHNGGVNILNSSGKRIGQFHKNSLSGPINSDTISSLMVDSSNRVWIGHQFDGINIYNPITRSMQSFERIYPNEKLLSHAITFLYSDSKKNIWIGSRQGINVLDSTGKSMIKINKSAFPNQLYSEYINCIMEDAKGFIWVGTHGGLSMFDPINKKLITFTTSEGLADNKVLGILNDGFNHLWVSTNNGLSKLNPETHQFISFNAYDGLPGNVFNNNSFFKDSKGRMYFGSFKGFVEFVPEQIGINTFPPNIVPTSLIINGNALNIESTGKSLNLHELKEITLPYNENTIALEFAIMNFIKPLKNKAAFKLIGFNNNWIYTNNPVASFINLPPGNYNLIIKASNNDGVWNNIPYEININILPPPWKSWWAYTLYILAFVLLLSGTIFFFSSRTALKRKLRYEHLVNEKQSELHQMKIDFFTHISHELRTPLTLIIGPAEMLTGMVPPKSTMEKLVLIIQSNAERLLNLTNDLLNFRKADAGYTELKIRLENIVVFSRNIFQKFTMAAAEKNIFFHFTAKPDNIDVYFDAAHMEIVLSNLLSNAIKFTGTGGNIYVRVNQSGIDYVEIQVCDNGIGIPKESQDKIFSHFYQADAGGKKHSGSGIGLAFSKSLVELHGGTLFFISDTDENTREKRTCFTVTLKTGKEHFSDKILIAD